MPSIQQKQQVIRSLLQNFNWETNPDWQKSMIEIDDKIKEYWENYLKREYTKAYGK